MGCSKNHVRAWSFTLALIVALAALPAGAETLSSITTDGWSEIQPGVQQRLNEEGRWETRATGPEGLEYGLDLLRAQLATLTRVYLENPTDQTRQAVADHTRFIEAVEAGTLPRLTTRRAAPKLTCDYDLDLGTDAGPNSPPHCGGHTSAHASYVVEGVDCDACYIYTYTYWAQDCVNQTLTGSLSCSDYGTNVSCSVWDHPPYQPNDLIHVYAYAYIYCPTINSLFLSDVSSETFQHPLCPTCG